MNKAEIINIPVICFIALALFKFFEFLLEFFILLILLCVYTIIVITYIFIKLDPSRIVEYDINHIIPELIKNLFSWIKNRNIIVTDPGQPANKIIFGRY